MGTEPPVLVEVTRGGLVESCHRGHLVVLGEAGCGGVVLLDRGDSARAGYPRSALKPVQAVGMLVAGLRLGGAALAVAAASHSAEPVHLALVRGVLAGAGLTEADLGCPAVAGERIRHNCSGKHAAMLATCQVAGWPTRGYLDAEHPLQRELRATVERLAGEPVAGVAVDGCGAPLFALSLRGLARAFGRLVVAAEGSPERAVADAVRSYPGVVGGEGRAVTRLMRQVPGLLAKDGAEGICAAALPGGAAIAFKIEDGGDRGRAPLLLAALAALGVEARPDPDLVAPPVLGGDRPVGTVAARPLTI
ncbi:MAG: asparaginase [Mycobacteriales bacterium]